MFSEKSKKFLSVLLFASSLCSFISCNSQASNIQNASKVKEENRVTDAKRTKNIKEKQSLMKRKCSC